MPDEHSYNKWCNMSQYLTGSQTKNASIAASTCFTVMVQCILEYDMKVISRDKTNCRETKIVDFLGVSTCRTTSFQ